MFAGSKPRVSKQDDIEGKVMIKKICNDVYKEFLSGEKLNNKKLFEKIRKLDSFFITDIQ